ncbi:MAG: DUF3500 domain-containing protein [Geminicoccaceae bacterium]
MTILAPTGMGHADHLVAGDMAGVAAAMTEAATDWLSSLSGPQQKKAIWPFSHPERGDWHYAPRERHGLPLGAMDEPQREKAKALLASALSPHGRAKALAIMALETVLLELEKGTGPRRDPLNYAFTVFGEPGTPPWGWRIEGHHLIVNATIADREVAISPTFWGTNPARIPHGPRAGERIQADEYHLGLELARSLTGAQRAIAVFAEHSVGNIITERGRAQALERPTGLSFVQLDDGQRSLVMRLLHAHIGNAADPLAESALRRAEHDGFDHMHLAWAGGTVEGSAFYYRLHAPRLLVEFDCTQNDANHIHALWRDPTRDWGRDFLGEHYSHHHDHD